MSIASTLRQAPGRISTGAFILNSGLGKLTGTPEQAQRIHAMTAHAYPIFDRVPPKPFLKVLAVSEVALGAALLAPFVPAGIAGAGLTGFSGGLLGLWWRTPGLHEPGRPKPTPAGTAIAKDVWMLGIGLGLMIDAALTGARRPGSRHRG
jgi:hypothetical protein